MINNLGYIGVRKNPGRVNNVNEASKVCVEALLVLFMYAI